MNIRGYDIDPKCPKCGDISGFNHSKPAYANNRHELYSFQGDVGLEEWLEYKCNSCGYMIKTDTADAKEDK